VTLRGAVFDFDGLILDTESPEFTSWRDIFAEHGCALSLEDWSVCIGTADVFDPCAHLESQLGRPVDHAALKAERRRRSNALIAVQVPLPGVVERIEEARAMGVKLAVASSSDRNWVEGHLERLGLAPHFACIRCSDHVEVVKPDPMLYRVALEGLGVAPEEAIAFEDSPNGILAAKRAGLFCVAVPNEATRELALDAADLCVPSLADVTLADLARRLTRANQASRC
jgi:HAD superfamily hydrolase (TIGR01509 family)